VYWLDPSDETDDIQCSPLKTCSDPWMSMVNES
jgi:hypothetical protein